MNILVYLSLRINLVRLINQTRWGAITRSPYIRTVGHDKPMDLNIVRTK